MMKKKNFPKIHPSIVKDQNGKEVEVYLKYTAYASILEEVDYLNKKIVELKKEKLSKNKHKKASK